MPGRKARFGFCEQELHFPWGKTLRVWAPGAAAVTVANPIHLWPRAAVGQALGQVIYSRDAWERPVPSFTDD